MNVEVRMPYDGDLTMDCSGSDFDIGSLSAYDSDGNEFADVEYAASILTVHDLVHGGDYWFTIDGADYISSATFNCNIQCSSDAPTKSPTTEPTTEPTLGPTTEPTLEPTTDPTVGPTLSPTTYPTLEPTDDPTSDPTVDPTDQPSTSPTTPAPTHPGELTCDSHDTGDYNGEPMEIEVRMPYDGDLTMDCSGSNFQIGSMTAYDSDSNELTDADAAESILTVHDLSHGGDYTFIVDGADGVLSGIYDCTIQCSSDSPTKSPTTDPTEDPTTDPTVDPTENPTSDPTVSPSDSPTESPTAAPTSEPTDSPTTPAPTHPGEKICGDRFDGTYHGEPMNVEVRMPYDGDMIMDCSACDFEIADITAYDSDANELTDANPDGATLEAYDLVHGGDYFFIIEGAPDVTEGNFDCTIVCTSDAPTKAPTVEPTADPTPAPTHAPTGSPTKAPTKRPTGSPTDAPTGWPTVSPTPKPTDSPTAAPTPKPTDSPTTPSVPLQHQRLNP